jgi:hypothetical protein
LFRRLRSRIVGSKVMTATHRILAGIFTFCAAAGFAGYATAQNADKPEQAAPAREEEALSVVFDPTFVERLQQLQSEHRKTRDLALKDPKAWDEGRVQRASQDRAELAKLWSHLVDSADAQARLRVHADHMARLNRMLDLAQASADAVLTQRVQTAIEAELVQHAQNMQTLRAALRLQ